MGMSTVLTPAGQSVQLELVNVNIKCVGCNKGYNIGFALPRQKKTCRFCNGVIHLSITPSKGKLHISSEYEYPNTQRVNQPLDGIYHGEDVLKLAK